MATWRERSEAVTRHFNALGPWRTGIGVIGICYAYAGLIAQFAGVKLAEHFDVVLPGMLLLGISSLASMTAHPSAKEDPDPHNLVLKHFALLSIILFMLWGLKSVTIWIPQTREDFHTVAWLLFAMVWASRMLVLPRAARVDALEPEPHVGTA